jgi:FtsP/CotA-like multicopper oxidase with cupredoxin domain
MVYLNGGEATTGGGYGMRVEPLSVRLANNPDPSVLFSSRVHGDPDTPTLRAYLGDPVVFRMMESSANEVHTWHVSGHAFPVDRYNGDAMMRNTIHLTIGERYDVVIPAAGGPQKMAGDYMYYSGRASHFSEGAWGLVRVLDKEDKTLKPLPGHEEIPQSAKEVCPSDAPVKTFHVSAIDYALKFNKGTPTLMEVDLGRNLSTANENGKIYVMDDEVNKVKGGMMSPNPLTLRVNVGDCIKISLTNMPASMQICWRLIRKNQWGSMSDIIREIKPYLRGMIERTPSTPLPNMEKTPPFFRIGGTLLKIPEMGFMVLSLSDLRVPNMLIPRPEKIFP